MLRPPLTQHELHKAYKRTKCTYNKIIESYKIYLKFPVRFKDFFVGSGVMECAVRSDLRCHESSYGHHAWLSSHRAARAHEEQISHASAIWLSPPASPIFRTQLMHRQRLENMRSALDTSAPVSWSNEHYR